MGPAPKPLADRLLAKRVMDPLYGCWTWTGTRGGYRCQYGTIGVGSMVDGTRRPAYVHRVAYELWVGPLVGGLQIDHLCHNTLCFNPAHLDLVTPATNTDRQLDRRHVATPTTCGNGHDLTEHGRPRAENQRLRACRLCSREYSRRYRERKGRADMTPKDDAA